MDYSQIWAAAGGGLVLVIGALAVGFRDVILVWMRRLASHIGRYAFATRLHLLADFYRTMESLDKIDGVDGVTIFSGHNCGGWPSPGKPFFLTALGGWRSGRENMFTHYGHQFSADSFMVEQIVKLMSGQTLDLRTSQLPECKLKSFYKTDGVELSRSLFLGVVDESMLYLSASLSKELSELARAQLDTVVERLRAIVADAA